MSKLYGTTILHTHTHIYKLKNCTLKENIPEQLNA